MKKLLMVMTVVGFVACNNSSESTTPSVDSTVKAVADSTASKADSTVKAVADTATKKIDSTVKAVKDSLKK